MVHSNHPDVVVVEPDHGEAVAAVAAALVVAAAAADQA